MGIPILSISRFDQKGLHPQPLEDPAVFTVSQGSFATAPVPPQFAVDAAGGQWRRSNRGGRQGWSHGDLRFDMLLDTSKADTNVMHYVQ